MFDEPGRSARVPARPHILELMLSIGRGRRLRTCAGLALVLPAVLSAQRYVFTHYGAQEGLERLNTRVLLQERDGFLWVGTGGGLYRFDGNRFRAFGAAQGLPNSRIKALHQTVDGVLWVGTGAGLAYRKAGRFETVNFALPPGRDLSVEGGIVSDAEGRMWVGTDLGLFRAEPAPAGERKFVAVSLPPEPATGVFGLHLDREEALWFGYAGRLCRHGPDSSVVCFSAESGLPPQDWKATLTDTAGNLWVRSAERLLVRRRGEIRFVPMDRDLPRSREVVELAMGRSGQLVVPTQLGLFTRIGDRWMRTDSSHGLLANAVCCVVWDYEGSPWIGLESFGVARWVGHGEWEHWTDAEGLTANAVMSMARDAAGNLWVGTESGLNRMPRNGEAWKRWTRKDGLPHDEVRSLAADPYGGVWIGSGQGGLARADARSEGLRVFGLAQGLGNDHIVFLKVDRAQTLWAGTRDGLYRADLTRQPIRFWREELPPGEPGETIYRIVEAKDGALWAAGTRGLLRRRDGQWVRLDVPLRHRSLVFLAPGARANEIWIGYGGVPGIARLVFDGARAHVDHFTEGDYLHSGEISFIESDGRGWIWVGTDRGADVFDGRRWRHFSQQDGLIWDDLVLGGFLADGDGSVWMGTQRGLSHFSPRSRTPAATPPPVRILSAQLGSRTTDALASAAAETEERTVRVDFAALTFRSRQAVTFRYRLLGLNDGWIQSEQSNAVFTNLGPGSYRFEVMARDGEGVWSAEPASWTLEVKPTLRETWWFRVLLGILALVLLRAFWKRREKRLLAVQQKLEQAVRDRTLQLELEKNRTEAEKARVEEQKREIERLLTEAREASRLKSEFLANVSHEIRTPMNGVLGMTALTLDTELTSEQREYLETIKSAGHSLLQLLNDILDFSKIEAGRLDLERVAFPARAFLEETIRTFSYAAREKGLALLIDVDPAIPESFVGDPVRLRQVLLNLVSNAIKFTHRGSITVQMAREDQRLARFTVTDTGIGIAPNKSGFIFDPFRQADGSTTRKYGGTGLGLAICARLVELMGGTVGVESEPGLGSRFSFTASLLDSTEESLPNPPAAATAAGSAAKPLRILLVEDNLVSRKVATALLEKRGHQVVAAESGRKALDILTREDFHAVLMDMQMPELDGLEATRALRLLEQNGRRRTPILMLTANALKGDRERCLEAGADGYLAKPVRPEELYAAIERM